ncbi:MAG: hypothetical protein NUV40_04345 [Patescibacteria group bacterium]|nr:hypothetical protein [Patescibacteria group bacterium]
MITPTIKEILDKKPSEITATQKTAIEIILEFNPRLTPEERFTYREKFNLGPKTIKPWWHH